MADLPALERLMEMDVLPWIPNKEEDHPKGITGTVLKITSVLSDYSGEQVPVLEVLPEGDGNTIWRVVAYATVLAKEIAEQRPRRGDRIGIRYQGRKAGGKNEYESYRVAVERTETAEESIDWDAIETAAAAEAAKSYEPFPEQGQPFPDAE